MFSAPPTAPRGRLFQPAIKHTERCPRLRQERCGNEIAWKIVVDGAI